MASKLTDALCQAIMEAAADPSIDAEVKKQIADDLLGMIELVTPEQADDLSGLDGFDDSPLVGSSSGTGQDTAARESVEWLLGQFNPRKRVAALREGLARAASLDAFLAGVNAPDPRPKARRSVVPPRVDDLLRDV